MTADELPEAEEAETPAHDASAGEPPEADDPGRAWLRLAEQDLVAARVLLGDPSAANRIACFLAQQAAEKALKAGLISSDEAFPKIHGLTELLGRFPDDRRPTVDPEDLDVLDPWVIDGRYAADLPEVGPVEAGRVVDLAAGVVTACRPFVG